MPQRVTNLAGHTLRPYYQYVMKVNMRTSPVDKLGNRRLMHLHSLFRGWNNKLVQPDLRITLKEDPEVADAYFSITYKNNWTNTYSLGDKSMDDIDQSLKDYGIYVWDHMNYLQEDEDYDMALYKF